MRMIDINLDPPDRTLRQFGIVALVFFALLGALITWKGGLFGIGFGGAAGPVVWALWAIAGFSGLCSAVAPRGNRPLYVALVILSLPIGLVLSYVIMGLLFYVLITGVAVVFRLMGRDVLDRRFDPEATTYWVPRDGPEPAPERYFKQF